MDALGTLRLFNDEADLPAAFVPRLTDSYGNLPNSASPLFQAIVAARQGLLARQRDDGSWQSDVPGDVTLASQMILLWSCLGRLPSDDGDRVAKQIASAQLDSGGWAVGPGDSVDLNASVLAYVALKLVGYEASTEPLQRARRAIRRAGGADRTGALVRSVLALLGQIQYNETPALPPELVMRLSTQGLLSRRAQALLIPQSIVWATRPQARVDDNFTVRELFIDHPCDWPETSWGLPESNSRASRIRSMLSRIALLVKRPVSEPHADSASARQWLRDRLASGDALPVDLTQMVWSILALRASGMAEDSPEICFLLQQLGRLRVETKDGIGFRGHVSIVGETARVLAALEASGLGAEVAAVRRGREWLFALEGSNRGDSSNDVADRCGSWTSDPASAIDADMGATAAVVASCCAVPRERGTGSQQLPAELQLIADGRDGSKTPSTPNIDRQTQHRAVLHGRDWLCQMQQDDGRWTTADPGSQSHEKPNNPVLGQSSGEDITGVVLEALGARGLRRGTSTADRAIDHLNRTQRADGSWTDACGKAPVVSTWQALLGLASVGAADHETARAAVNWLFAHQRTDGSWTSLGDDEGDENVSKSQQCVATSGVVLACVAAGYADHLAVARGIEFLIDAQHDDGSWPDEPCVSDSLQPGQTNQHPRSALSLPLLALSRYAATASMSCACVDQSEPPRLKLFVSESAIA